MMGSWSKRRKSFLLKQIGMVLVLSLVVVTPVVAAQNYKGVQITAAVDGGCCARPFLWAVKPLEQEYGIKLKVVELPRYEVFEKLMMEFVAQTGAYDICVIFPPMMGSIFGAKYAYPIDELIRKYGVDWSDIVPTFRELYCKWAGTTYALPYDGDVHILYYRKDLFNHPMEKANFKVKYGYELQPPRTWDEWIDVAKFFTRKKGEKLAGKIVEDDFYGCSELVGKGDGMYYFLNRFLAFGGRYFDQNMNPEINGPAGVKALKNLKQSIKFAPPGVLSYEYTEHRDAYIKGRCAMEVQWTCVGVAAEDAALSTIIGKTGYGLQPGVEEGGKIIHRCMLPSGRYMFMSADCKNPEAAFQVMRHISSPDVSLLNAMGVPQLTACDAFRYSHFESERFRNAWDTADDYLNAILANIEHGRPDLKLPGTYEYYSVLMIYVHRAILGEMSTKEALDAVAREWKEITEKYGVENQRKLYMESIQAWRELGIWE